MNDNMIQYFKLIGKIQKEISRAQNLREALEESLQIVNDNIPSDESIIWYLDSNQQNLLRPYYWLGDRDFTSCVHQVGCGDVGKTFESQKAIRKLSYVPDEETDKDFPDLKITSMICVPFSSDEENLGVIQLVSTRESYSEETADLVEIIANMIALAITDNEKLKPEWRFSKVVLSTRGITKSFQNGDVVTQVLKGVNLDVYEGEFLVILGESGCGKSTFLNIIGGLERADSGSFLFEHQEMFNASEEKLTAFRRDNIGFIFQQYNLMPNLTAKQNLNLIGELVKNPMDAQKALELVGLSDKQNNYPSQLSGGQQQRVSIARALVKNPKIIFADEPTAALDYTTSIEVLSVLEKVIQTGTTLIMVTHNEEITRMADRVVRIRQGKVHEITINRHRVHATDLVW